MPLYNPSSGIPALVTGKSLVAPVYPGLMGNAVSVGVTNFGIGCRVVCPVAGTLHDLSVWVQASSGNVDVGIYDTGDATPGTRTRLYHSGSIACPASGSWQILADPSLAVTAGQQLDFIIAADNTTATFGVFQGFTDNASQLPNAFLGLPAATANPKMSFYIGSNFPLPTTLAEASLNKKKEIPLIVARIS